MLQKAQFNLIYHIILNVTATICMQVYAISQTQFKQSLHTLDQGSHTYNMQHAEHFCTLFTLIDNYVTVHAW